MCRLGPALAMLSLSLLLPLPGAAHSDATADVAEAATKLAALSSSPTVVTSSGPIVGQSIEGVDVRPAAYVLCSGRALLAAGSQADWLECLRCLGCGTGCAGFSRSSLRGATPPLCSRR
jgi:hypothetical protein